MKFALFPLLSALSAASNDWKSHLDTFKHLKTLNSEDLAKCEANFLANAEFIASHNEASAAYRLALNKYSHLSPKEFGQKFLTYRPSVTEKKKHLKKKPRANSRDSGYGVTSAPVDDDSIDWAELGATSSVQNQGVCAACWAFSATGGLEAAHFIKTGELVKLSVQNLLNCDDSEEDNGCHGTYYGMDSAFNWIISNGGLCTGEVITMVCVIFPLLV